MPSKRIFDQNKIPHELYNKRIAERIEVLTIRVDLRVHVNTFFKIPLHLRRQWFSRVWPSPSGQTEFHNRFGQVLC